MAAPPEVKKNRWDQAVRAISRDTGWDEPSVDAWLNDVWAGMFTGDEIQAWIDGHSRLKLWLEVNSTVDSATLPMAFYRWVV